MQGRVLLLCYFVCNAVFVAVSVGATAAVAMQVQFNSPNPELVALAKEVARDFEHPLSTKERKDFEKALNQALKERGYIFTQLVDNKPGGSIGFSDHYAYGFDFVGLPKGVKEFSVPVGFAKDLGGGSLKEVALRHIGRHYRQQGFGFVQVQGAQTQQGFKRRISFTVTPGPRVRFDLRVYGSDLKKSHANRYRAQVVRAMRRALRHRFYARAGLDEALQRLLMGLRERGYLKSQLKVTQEKWSPDKSYVEVFLFVNLGTRMRVRSISFKGQEAFEEELLRKKFSPHEGDYVDLSELQKALQEVESFYKEQGFLHAVVDVQNVAVVEDARYVDLEVVIQEGVQVRVAEVLVEGLSRTKRSVVERETGLRQGEILTPLKMNKAAARLNLLPVFKSADVQTLDESSSASRQSVWVKLSERPSGVITMGGGVSNKYGLVLKAFTGVEHRNLWGTARGVAGRVEGRMFGAELLSDSMLRPRRTLWELDMRASYFEPFFAHSFVDRMRARLSVRYARGVRCVNDLNLCPEYVKTEKATTFSGGLEKTFGSHHKLVWSVFRWRREQLFNLFMLSPVAREHGKGSSGLGALQVRNIVTMGPRWEVNFTDNILLPHKGFWGYAQLDYAPLWRHGHFLKLDLGSRYFVPLGESLGLAFGAQGGWLKNLYAKGGVPGQYAFFLGGVNSIRGFSGSTQDRVPSSYEFKPVDPWQAAVMDRSYYYLLKVELRVPVFKNLGAAVFYDGGAVGVDELRFQKPYRHAWGLGLRLETPVGPIRADYARKFSPQTFSGGKRESPDYFSLSMGSF